MTLWSSKWPILTCADAVLLNEAATNKMAAARAYDFILDKSEGITIIFADPKLDKSDDVLKELGIVN